MRKFVAAALVALATFVVAPASAADLGWRPAPFARFVERADPIVIYDFEPGIVVRAYWRSPWQGRRYFPASGTKPEVGRDEDTSGDRQKPAQDFYRSWSTSHPINRVLTGADPQLDQFGPVPQK